MAYFQTKNTNLGKFCIGKCWYTLVSFGLFYGHLYTYWPFGITFSYILGIFFSCFGMLRQRKIWQPWLMARMLTHIQQKCICVSSDHLDVESSLFEDKQLDSLQPG
jgi:hypothetical protein